MTVGPLALAGGGSRGQTSTTEQREESVVSIRVGINGFGRMGRALYRASLQRDLGIEVVAVNELGSLPTMAGLLARDSVFGRLGRDIKIGEDEFVVDGSPVAYLSEKDPAVLPWKDLDVSVVVEATGRFRTRETAAGHLLGGRHTGGRVRAVQGCRCHHRVGRERGRP